jgi:hypothetical protein
LSNWISFLRKLHFSNESRKRKTNCSWPLTLIMQKRDHFRLLRHHYSESPVIPLSNVIWYRCVAHGFITFYFLIFYRWSIVDPFVYIARCISITEPSGWTSMLRDSWGTSNGSLVDFWGKLKNRSLYFYDLIRSKMSRNCILSVTELSYYYICHFHKIYRICSYTQKRHL